MRLKRFQLSTLRNLSRAPATSIRKSALTCRTNKHPAYSSSISQSSITSNMFKKSILLSSQPNPSSYSQLVKSRYRMAETKVPADPVQLPARYLERNKAEKARSIRHDWNEKGQKRKRKARMIATQADNVGPDTQLGAREMPIIIKDDRIPITRPENAPISFVDDLPGHAERLVTPDISRWHAISRIVIPSPSQEESITGR